jgi:PPOX class probable F420-dependent enzyme
MVTYTQTDSFASLKRASYINLTTFRKNGIPVATPVWFAGQDDIIYVQSGAQAGKVRRIHHTPTVALAPCTVGGKVTGAAIEGRARILQDEQEIAQAERTLAKKYGMLRRLYFAVMDAVRAIRRKPVGKDAYIAIEPTMSA